MKKLVLVLVALVLAASFTLAAAESYANPLPDGQRLPPASVLQHKKPGKAVQPFRVFFCFLRW